jgi:hypothetical protein
MLLAWLPLTPFWLGVGTWIFSAFSAPCVARPADPRPR